MNHGAAKMSTSVRGFAAAMLAASFFVCISSTPANVAYIGELLVISGKEYRADRAVTNFGPGVISVIAREGKTQELESRLTGYGLKITWRGTAVPAFTIEVPKGFETQWVGALRELASVETAEVNTRFHPASLK
jgi:hypothetical protein